jgi:hypothetical protein
VHPPVNPYETPAAGPYAAAPLPSYPQAPYGGQQPYGPGPYPGAAPGFGYPPPYPGGPQGWYAEDRSTNGFAIASLIASFTCFPFLGAILGFVGLRQINRRPQRGRGLAVSGLLINSLSTVLTVLLVVLAALGVFDEGNTKVADIRVGQCFNTVGRSLSDYGTGDVPSSRVNVVSCDSGHDAEAYATVSLDGFGPAYPGVDRIARYADVKCRTAAASYLGGGGVPEGVRGYYYMPPTSAWIDGTRSVICFFGNAGDKLTGSLKGGGADDAGGTDDSGIGV